MSAIHPAAASNLLWTSLPCSFALNGARWRLAGSEFGAVANTVPPLITGAQPIPANNCFKNEAKRKVFQLQGAHPSPLLAKSFCLDTLRQRLRHRRYAFNEALHLIVARKRGLNVPRVFGYGTGFCQLLPTWVAVLMEYLPYPSMRDEFLRTPDELTIWGLLQRAVPSFRQLYLTGCNHIDFGPHAILLSPAGAENDVLIDFQYAAFTSRPNPRILAAQLGYFGWAVGVNRNWVGREMLEQWYGEVLRELAIQPDDEIRAIIAQSAARRRSTTERLMGYPDTG